MRDFPRLFVLEIETSSYCNRRCITCIRNSHPDKETVTSWFEMNYMPTEDVLEIVKQVQDMGFTHRVNLSHYNEPLLDPRLPELGQRVKDLGFTDITFHSNGDFLTEKLAKELDGVFSHIAIALYVNDSPIKRDLITKMFDTTKIIFVDNHHVATHFSPSFPVATLARKHMMHSCIEPSARIIFNHKGQMLFCCEDVVGNFDLGSFPEQSVKELWDNAQVKIRTVSQPGGRLILPYCLSCPKDRNGDSK
jgi:hypothetical protein